MFKKEKNDILDLIKKIKKKDFDYKFIIKEIAYLILKVEVILFNHKLKNNPKKIIKSYLIDFKERLILLNKISKFSNNEAIYKQSFNLEKNHRVLFHKLWTYNNLKKFQSNRIDRYTRRLKINKLIKIIKDKKCVDFGCGHGNFLYALIKNGAKDGIGIDYGNESIKYARKISKILKFNKKIKFFNRSIYKSDLKSNKYEFAIQNGFFHHLQNEDLAYREVHRVLKKNGYFWIYTDGGGGIRDFINDLSQTILKNIKYDYVVNVIRSLGLSINKIYHLSDHMNVKYRHTTKEKLLKRLKRIGFKNFTQLKGGEKTDYDKPFLKDKYFKEKFGSGDLRILCQKK